MALPFRVSWLCMLLWGCICFAPQTGYTVAHEYHLYRSSQPSSHLSSGEILKPNDKGETNDILPHSFVSLESGNMQHLNPVRGFSGKMVQSHPGSVHKADRNQVWSRLDDHKIPGRHHSSNIPVYSPENIFSSNAHDSQVFSQRSVSHPNNHLGAPEFVSNETADVGLSGGPSGFPVRVSNHIRSNYKQPEQTLSPSRSFPGDNSVTGHMTDSFFDTSNRPSQDSSFFTRKSSRSGKSSRSVPLSYKQNIQKPKYLHHINDLSSGYPSDGSYGKDLHQVTHTGVFSQQRPPSSSHVVLKNKMRLPNFAAKNKKKTAKTSPCQSSVDNKSNHGCHAPTQQMTASARSLLNPKDRLPQRRDQKDFRENVLYKPHQELDKSNLEFNEQNKNTKAKPRGTDSTQKEVSPKTARNQLNSISDQDRFLFQNGGYEDALKAGLMKTYNQPNVFRMFSDPTNLAFWPSEFEVDPLDSNCIVWKSTLRSIPSKFPKSSQFFANTFAKLRKRPTRATALLSKTCYITIQQGQDKGFNRDRNPARRWRI
nr:uncharacterized protein LOC107388923 isoform X2 [Nothobranchius furzeri]